MACTERANPLQRHSKGSLSADARIHANMVSIYQWIFRQFGKLVLLPDYFRVIAKEWLNILFGETLVGIGFLLWWSLAGPSNAKLIAVFVVAMFVAGYHAWRADHIRLMPGLEVTQFTRQTTDTFDQTGKKNGWSEYLQLLPRYPTEANVEECRGLLTSIEMLDGFSNSWEPAEQEVMLLEWSHTDATPTTLYAHAERRLNVFFMHSSNREIRPCVTPYPVRFFTMFNQTQLRQIKAIRFKIRIIAKDCRALELTMKVQFGDDHSHPTVELEL
jgi:hypothetical protein